MSPSKPHSPTPLEPTLSDSEIENDTKFLLLTMLHVKKNWAFK